MSGWFSIPRGGVNRTQRSPKRSNRLQRRPESAGGSARKVLIAVAREQGMMMARPVFSEPFGECGLATLRRFDEFDNRAAA